MLMDEKISAAFISREKTAREKSRQTLALTLVALHLWQPFFNLAHAGSVVPGSAGTSLKQSANGVTVVNVAKPGAAGISHNSYSRFDVGSQGLIFNNSA